MIRPALLSLLSLSLLCSCTFSSYEKGRVSTAHPSRAVAQLPGDAPPAVAAAASDRPTPSPATMQVPKPSVPPPAGPEAPVTRMRQENAFALVIGVEKYRGALPPALHAETDARAVAKYLERTLGLPRANIRVLVGEHASKSDIEAAIEEWLRKRLQAGASGYFYFSGHGAPDPTTGDSYLVPYDGDPEYLKTKGIALSSVYQRLAKTRSKMVVMVDACFSGSGERSVLPHGVRPLVPVRQESVVGDQMAILAASSAAQISGAAKDAPHGLFTYHLLRGLSGLADRDGDQRVSLHELNLFVRRHVEAEARASNREQVPQLSMSERIQPGDWTIVDGLVE